MPKAPDAKMIINEAAAARAEGGSEIAARCRAINRCLEGGGFDDRPDLVVKLAQIERTYLDRLRRADRELIEQQDEILSGILDQR